jgi:hypothetical protein
MAQKPGVDFQDCHQHNSPDHEVGQLLEPGHEQTLGYLSAATAPTGARKFATTDYNTFSDRTQH